MKFVAYFLVLLLSIAVCDPLGGGGGAGGGSSGGGGSSYSTYFSSGSSSDEKPSNFQRLFILKTTGVVNLNTNSFVAGYHLLGLYISCGICLSLFLAGLIYEFHAYRKEDDGSWSSNRSPTVGSHPNTTFMSFQRGVDFDRAVRAYELITPIAEQGLVLLPSEYRFIISENMSPKISIEKNGFEILFKENQEGCVQTNLPVASQGTTYFEVHIKMVHKDTAIGIGLTTKPYPLFRLPGWNQFSVGYHSDDGRKYITDGYDGIPYASKFRAKNVVGCAYHAESQTVYFTLNGKKLKDAHRFKNSFTYALFPSVGANGKASVYVTFDPNDFKYQGPEDNKDHLS
jgi:hypothetical protein